MENRFLDRQIYIWTNRQIQFRILLQSNISKESRMTSEYLWASKRPKLICPSWKEYGKNNNFRDAAKIVFNKILKI